MALDTVDPNGAHDKKAFKKARQSYFTLEQLMGQAQKDARDAGLKEQVGGLLNPRNPDYYKQPEGDEMLKADLRRITNDVYGARLKSYVGKNLDDILKDSEKSLPGIVRQLPAVKLQELVRVPYNVFKKEMKKYEYDSGVSTLKGAEKALNKFAFVQGLLARDNEDEMDDYVLNELKGLEKSDNPEDQILTIQYMNARGYPNAASRAMQSFALQAEGEVENALYKTIPDGKDKKGREKFKKVFDDSNARQLIIKSYANAKDEVQDAYSDTIIQMAG